MSALRPTMRRTLMRTSRRSYATPANPSSASSTAEAAQQSARETGAKAKETVQLASESASQKASEVGSQTVAKAKETGNTVAAKAQETSAGAMAKAQETGQQAIAKAKDALAAAGPMASKLGESTAAAVSKIPGGGDKVVSGVQSLIPPAMYYSKVGLELSKQVMHGQKMTPPSFQTLQSFYAPYYKPLLNPSSYTWLVKPQTWGNQISTVTSAVPPPVTIVEQVRGMSRKQWAEYAVLGAEFLGFFTVGTMIGRMKIVGYRGGAPAHH